MLPVFAVAAGLLAVTAASDLGGGATSWGEEGPHALPLLAAVLMLALRGEDGERPSRGPLRPGWIHRDRPALGDRPQTGSGRRAGGERAGLVSPRRQPPAPGPARQERAG
jgi:hypothetical protein